MADNYTNESIKWLKNEERVRLRPGVMFGSDDIVACEHSVFEIISNSVDEARLGYGNRINITYFKDKSIEVEDFGRGIPVDYNPKEKRYNWELVFCELYAGGKYENEGGSYEYSIGLNGLGLCATQYASEYMEAEIFRDGFRYFLKFKAGRPVGKMLKEPTTHKGTGSRIKWRPDLKVFTDIDIGFDYFDATLRRQAAVNSGVTFALTYENDDGSAIKKSYAYQNGIVEYLEENTRNALCEPIVVSGERRGRDREDRPEYNLKMNFAFCFTRGHAFIEYFHNSSYLPKGGSPEKAVSTAFASQIDSYIRDKKLYRKNEAKIAFKDVAESLSLVSSSFSTLTSYSDQTKLEFDNAFITRAMTEFLKKSIQVYFIENPEKAEKIAEQILINKRSRESAEQARAAAKSTMQAKADLAQQVQKFVDCRSKDMSIREVYIVEGDSALGACKQGRDAEFQAIMPVRGKILNCLKVDFQRIFKSEIITDLVKVLGCGVEVSSKYNKNLSTFSIDNLRWNKVIICTDADVDGYQIRTLILTMIYRLMPRLITEGYVYIAESPLFEINTKDKTYYAYTEQEKAEIMEMIGDEKFTLQRSKGLGENEPEMMWMTTMNPLTRRLIRVTEADAEDTARTFDLLLGDNLAGRKEYIALHGAEYMDMLDLS